MIMTMYLKALIGDPRAVASVAPTGRRLARLLAVPAVQAAGADGLVLELGPGSGAITRQLLQAGLQPQRLHWVELLPRFAKHVQRHFPHTHGHVGSALELQHTLGTHATPGSFAAVVSGMPVLVWSAAEQHQLLQQVFALLAPGGVYAQFTYARRCPIQPQVLDALGLEAHHIGTSLVNIPPGRAYLIHRRGEMPAHLHSSTNH